MDDKLKDILSNLNNDVDQEKLLQYLNSQLSDAEQHDVEASATDDPFLSDAMDGLQSMPANTNYNQIVGSINKSLKEKLSDRKTKRRNAIPSQMNTIYAVVLILLLIVIIYLVIKIL